MLEPSNERTRIQKAVSDFLIATSVISGVQGDVESFLFSTDGGMRPKAHKLDVAMRAFGEVIAVYSNNDSNYRQNVIRHLGAEIKRGAEEEYKHSPTDILLKLMNPEIDESKAIQELRSMFQIDNQNIFDAASYWLKDVKAGLENRIKISNNKMTAGYMPDVEHELAPSALPENVTFKNWGENERHLNEVEKYIILCDQLKNKFDRTLGKYMEPVGKKQGERSR